ncbi:MAG: rhomboid family intramembrane serine protease [Ignavibacteria bacterium]
MLPIGDENIGRVIKPIVNFLFIAVNVLVFVFLQHLGTNEKFTFTFSCVPEEIVTGKDLVTKDQKVQDPITGDTYIQPGLQKTPGSVYFTLITSIFMHGGIAHIFGNMLFLFIFGDNLENRLGHFRYFIFYMVCGVLASLAHVIATVVFGQNPLIPSLGASGAISGVLGGYIVLFPKNRVRVLIFRYITEVPAFVALGMWFAFQLISGLGMLGAGSQEGGVAYAAHIGGFAAGLVLIKFFTIGRSASESRIF